MKLAFVMPCVGRLAGRPYVRTWQMEPLAIAVLSALTPAGWEKRFYDDRLEEIDYSFRPDVAAINVETYTARRAYQIAERFKAAGAKVVMGGFHASLCPDEALEHADVVVAGSAEPVWAEVLADLAAGRSKGLYRGDIAAKPAMPDRSIYAGKAYTPVTLVETGRGCRHRCEFCSITSFFGATWTPRPVKEALEDMRSSGRRVFFFIDDNLVADRSHARSLLEALVPLRIRWIGQISLDAARDPVLVELMRKSGCIGVLIGFESLDAERLSRMGKGVNRGASGYAEAIAALRRSGIAVYATFLFGYGNEDASTFQRTLDFCLEQRFFFAAFNHLVPFPGTPLYGRLKAEGRLIYERWWLEPGYRFGDLAFRPDGLEPSELSRLCLLYRKKFYSLPSLLRRGLDFRANCNSAFKWAVFWSQGLIGRGDIDRRQGLPLGLQGMLIETSMEGNA
jgi:radical SAM superfamily enzyme YgiQ (UPF0313 family)